MFGLMMWVDGLQQSEQQNIIIRRMDDEDGEFFVEPEEEEVREIKEIQEANPIYSKPAPEPTNVTLKMVEIQREEPTFYTPFKITFKKTESEEEEEESAIEFGFESPFSEYYSRDQLVYQKFDNSAFNKVKGITYFSGAYVQKSIFTDFTKYSEDSASLKDIVADYFDMNVALLPEPSGLVFSSDFQSGNLFAAFKISEREYDLVMQNDVNSYGNNQWFYFSVEGMVAGAEYTFNVVNFTKNDSLFNYGMGPAIFSTMEQRKNGREWYRGGQDVTYKKGSLPRQNSRRYYYKLSFKITNKFANDKLYLAHSYPYTYEKLLNRLEAIASKHPDIVSRITIGKTISKKNIEALVITQKAGKKKDNRKALIVMARQHPGQTQGSFVCDGVIDRLLQKGSKEGEYLRKNYIVYVIPMVNPDGVIFGHYRTNLSGRDLNRKWDSTEKQLNVPEVTCIKSFIQELSKQRQIRFILDLHGHSKKLNSFFYGNPCVENPELVRIFPYLCSKLSPAVEYMDCTFASEEYKRKAARVYLSYYYKQIHVYTFQSSFYAYFKEGKKQQFTPKQYESLGGTLMQALQLVLDNDIKILDPKSKDAQMFSKYMQELKTNRSLLEVGALMQSGSESRPEQGEINITDLPEIDLSLRKPITPALTEEMKRKSSKRMNSRKGTRQPREVRQVNKPVRNIRFLQINRVNSVLPDRYQLGLQPIRKKETEAALSRNQSHQTIKINSHCQTDAKELPLEEYRSKDIQECKHLSNSTKMPVNDADRRYSSVIKNTSRNTNIIFKIDLLNERSSSTLQIKSSKKVMYNAFSQTMASFPVGRPLISPNKSERIRSSQLFPFVQTPESDRKAGNSIKYENKKLGMKRQAQIFLNGMVKKYLVDKEMKMKEMKDGGSTRVIERPLSIKKKEIYRK